ncbi:MAG: putative toxin-antitoxin system toxin component, PIN family [Bulleidia sp.]|nr:putative toxin-antitoxin system toxin component, PIN family [Bulleidia sp.]
MRIVIDTNVLISGCFFGGAPARVLKAVCNRKINAFVTNEILEEYMETISELIERKQGHLNPAVLYSFMHYLTIVDARTQVKASRDPDDDKFIGCALDAKALYIISGDNDLLALCKYEDVEIITAREFCQKYLDT